MHRATVVDTDPPRLAGPCTGVGLSVYEQVSAAFAEMGRLDLAVMNRCRWGHTDEPDVLHDPLSPEDRELDDRLSEMAWEKAFDLPLGSLRTKR